MKRLLAAPLLAFSALAFGQASEEKPAVPPEKRKEIQALLEK